MVEHNFYRINWPFIVDHKAQFHRWGIFTYWPTQHSRFHWTLICRTTDMQASLAQLTGYCIQASLSFKVARVITPSKWVACWQHRSKWPLPTWAVTYILSTLITPKFVISAQIYTDTPIQVENLESWPPPPPPNLPHPNNRPTAYALNRDEMRLFYCKHRLLVHLDRRSSGQSFAWLPELPQPKPMHSPSYQYRYIYSIPSLQKMTIVMT